MSKKTKTFTCDELDKLFQTITEAKERFDKLDDITVTLSLKEEYEKDYLNNFFFKCQQAIEDRL